MEKPTLAFIDVDVLSGKDEAAREQLLRNLDAFSDEAVVPLWVTWLREHAELQIGCLVRNPVKFGDFLIDHLRSVEGVRATRSLLAFDGNVRPNALIEMPTQLQPGGGMYAATVLISVQPGRDREVFEELWNIPKHPGVTQIWLLRIFHSPAADLMLLLLGHDEAAITGYVMSWIRTTDGVLGTEVSTVFDWHHMATPDHLIELAELFFEERPRIAR